MKLFIFALITTILFTACAASPEKVAEVANAEAALLTAPTRTLSSFASFDLKPMTFSDGIAANKGKLEEGEEFEANLTAKLTPLIDSWNAKAQGSGTLTIQPALESLRIISGGSRFWAGAMAGDSHIEMNLKLIDAVTGEELASPQIRRGTGGNMGSLTIGKTDQNLDDYIVGIVYEYLRDSY